MVYVMEFKYTDCPQDAAPEKKRELFRKQGDGSCASWKEAEEPSPCFPLA